jgi:hypothetical protein
MRNRWVKTTSSRSAFATSSTAAAGRVATRRRRCVATLLGRLQLLPRRFQVRLQLRPQLLLGHQRRLRLSPIPLGGLARLALLLELTLERDPL